jgi:hypothetical protein
VLLTLQREAPLQHPTKFLLLRSRFIQRDCTKQLAWYDPKSEGYEIFVPNLITFSH